MTELQFIEIHDGFYVNSYKILSIELFVDKIVVWMIDRTKYEIYNPEFIKRITKLLEGNK